MHHNTSYPGLQPIFFLAVKKACSAVEKIICEVARKAKPGYEVTVGHSVSFCSHDLQEVMWWEES